MKEIPEHWKNFYLKLEDRGWIDENGDPIKQTPKFDDHKISKINIPEEEYLEIMNLLLDLSIQDNNPQIAEAYFELIRRGQHITKTSMWTEKARQLYNIGMNKNQNPTNISYEQSDSLQERIKCDVSGINPNPIPMEKDDYDRLIHLFGALIVNDKIDPKDIHSKIGHKNFVELFLNLQDRATRFNEYEPDNELSEITTKIKEMKSEEIQR